MSQKVRIVYRADGGVSIIHPAPNSRKKDETEARWLERVFTKTMHDEREGCDYDDVDESEVPSARKYRDAWTGSKGQGISIDQTKKAEIDARPIYTEEQEVQLQAKMREIAARELGL